MPLKNPRSRIGKMKRRYFFATMACYLVYFFIAFLIAELLFMIFETIPIIRLAVMIAILIVDIILTKKTVNGSLSMKWLRYDYSIYSPKHDEIEKNPEIVKDLEKKEEKQEKKQARKNMKEKKKQEKTEQREERKELKKEKAEAKEDKNQKEKKKASSTLEKPAVDSSSIPSQESILHPKEIGQDLSDEEINRVLQKLVQQGALESADETRRKTQEQSSQNRDPKNT